MTGGGGAGEAPAGRRGVAVVTAGSAGAGRAIVRRLADEGFDVAVLARGEAGIAAAADDVRARGRRALAVAADVADWDDVDAAASRIETEFGPIDLWVNNAMATVFSWSWEVGPEELRRATEVTYLGQVHGTLAALHRMRPRHRGRIVNIGSSLAYVGIPLQAAYCAAKLACRGFTSRCAPSDVLQEQVQSVPLKRAAEPGEIARMALFLTSGDASYVTGATYVMDGGLMQMVGQGA
jgi:NAD(P)-dependent dehydrogenase (short-subunit alcohol dehydrogenase family)